MAPTAEQHTLPQIAEVIKSLIEMIGAAPRQAWYRTGQQYLAASGNDAATWQQLIGQAIGAYGGAGRAKYRAAPAAQPYAIMILFQPAYIHAGMELDTLLCRQSRQRTHQLAGMQLTFEGIADQRPHLRAEATCTKAGAVLGEYLGIKQRLQGGIDFMQPLQCAQSRLGQQFEASRVFIADRLIAEAPVWLRAGGWLLLEVADVRAAQTAARMQRAGFVQVEVVRDLAGRERIVLGRTGI